MLNDKLKAKYIRAYMDVKDELQSLDNFGIDDEGIRLLGEHVKGICDAIMYELEDYNNVLEDIKEELPSIDIDLIDDDRSHDEIEWEMEDHLKILEINIDEDS